MRDHSKVDGREYLDIRSDVCKVVRKRNSTILNARRSAEIGGLPYVHCKGLNVLDYHPTSFISSPKSMPWMSNLDGRPDVLVVTSACQLEPCASHI